MRKLLAIVAGPALLVSVLSAVLWGRSRSHSDYVAGVRPSGSWAIETQPHSLGLIWTNAPYSPEWPSVSERRVGAGLSCGTVDLTTLLGVTGPMPPAFLPIINLPVPPAEAASFDRGVFDRQLNRPSASAGFAVGRQTIVLTPPFAAAAGTYRARFVYVPFAAVVAGGMVPAALMTLGAARRRRRHRQGRCTRCGYDRRGSPVGRCPECGAVATVGSGQPARG